MDSLPKNSRSPIYYSAPCELRLSWHFLINITVLEFHGKYFHRMEECGNHVHQLKKKHEVNIAILSQKQGAASSGQLGDTTQEVWRYFLFFFCCFVLYMATIFVHWVNTRLWTHKVVTSKRVKYHFRMSYSFKKMWQTTKDLKIQYFVPLWINYVWDASTPKCCQWQQWEKNNMSVKVAGSSVLVRGNVLLVRGPVLKSSSSSLCFAAVYKLCLAADCKAVWGSVSAESWTQDLQTDESLSSIFKNALTLFF